ncbi:hypothetical protein D7B24_003356 [Verticillium nonalfalfae]|uniref:Uncharacterized protein n=1 Tax=Verticillium nonalfalfae TaxID=1051616 RepID=A0A3M9XY44_9PEZI|nr:uncharacterized protein D7B24_003356 [Verticillium nonalfalfae]RNJ52536.1 hypothetical protein D7B24_003356 [Verticillium nonalfalfae]
MLKIASIVQGICLSLLIDLAEGIDQAVNPTLVGRLKLSPTELDKIKLLPQDSCENATLVSALSSEDAGTHNVANGLFGMPSEVLAAAFGDSPLAMQFAALAQNIPAVGTGASEGSSECMRRCEGGPSF